MKKSNVFDAKMQTFIKVPVTRTMFLFINYNYLTIED